MSPAMAFALLLLFVGFLLAANGLDDCRSKPANAVCKHDLSRTCSHTRDCLRFINDVGCEEGCVCKHFTLVQDDTSVIKVRLCGVSPPECGSKLDDGSDYELGCGPLELTTSSLSIGTIIGIVISSVLVIAILVLVGFALYVYLKQKPASETASVAQSAPSKPGPKSTLMV